MMFLAVLAFFTWRSPFPGVVPAIFAGSYPFNHFYRRIPLPLHSLQLGPQLLVFGLERGEGSKDIRLFEGEIWTVPLYV